MNERSPQQPQSSSEEVARYNRTDWPGSESFHPPHLRRLAAKSLQASQLEVDDDQLPEIPSNIILGEE